MTAYSGDHHELVAVGGWSRSEALMAAKGRRLGLVRRAPVVEAGARGAALLAGLAAGAYASVDDFPDAVDSTAGAHSGNTAATGKRDVR
ncbi:hypothetical protein JNW91_10895 [Micromonospora sp. STR1_7]|uniref:Uncharacterized protein n=2 Tax=Micromonospora parastrephiae TaxID=2806101 RepID=A0ABS1XST8_9ACTN|nr:hypothetical protein [Micromonospora parastrephiae]